MSGFNPGGNNERILKFGERLRCQPSTEATTSNVNSNNNVNNFVPEPVAFPTNHFVPLHLRPPGNLNGRSERRRERPSGFMAPRRSNANDEEKPSMEAIMKLKKGLAELARELKRREQNPIKGTEEEEYTKRVMSDDTIKIFNPAEYGFQILDKTHSEKTKLEIMQSNKEILDFAYFQTYGSMEWNTLNKELVRYVETFVEELGKTSFRHGAFSIAIDFDPFPPRLIWRSGEGGNETSLLRPVVIDGIAVQHASTNDLDRPFYECTRSSCLGAQIPYCHELNLSVKPLFDVIMAFVIRGHKTVAYLPMYYKNFVTPGRISKIDDLVAFEALIKMGFIQFREVNARRHEKRWFKMMTELADEKQAVFVSSSDYRRKNEVEDFSKPSGRILTPCFLNTSDRLMVIQPTIRYRDETRDNKFHVIGAKTILTYENPDNPEALAEQLYLSDQIRLICSLCQLYPLKSLHKVSIKQLLLLVVHAEANFEMPFMTRMEYERMRQVLSSE